MCKRTNLKTWLVISASFLAMGPAALGGLIYVDADANGANDGSSWADAYNYLQDALADANSGDEIRVAQGTYTPDSNSAYPGGTGDRTATFQLISGVALYGGFPYGADPNWNDRDPNSYETILSGDINTPGDANDNSYNVVTGSGTDATAILDGFTITAGNANYGEWPDHSYFGGGMYNDNGSPTVINCTFSGNSAAEGGGVFNWDNSSPMVTNCTFSGNSAGSGSGGGIFNSQSSPTISNCTFSGNSAYYDGGGMYNYWNSNPTVTNCTFSGNSAGHGGGMQNTHEGNPTVTNCTFIGNLANSEGGGMENYLESNPTVTNCTFSGNSAETYGGGMNNRNNCNPTLTNCTFSDNSASWDGGGMVNLKSNPTVTNCIITGNSAGFRGGGMVNGESDPTVTNCTFSGNSAIRLYGGGMYNWDNSNPTLTNCTFSDNSSDSQGGGIYNKQSNPTLNNCILWGNSAPNGSQIHNAFTSSTTVTYSDVQGGWPGEGNTGADPCFIALGHWCDANDPNVVVEPDDPNAVWVQGDYHLPAGSPCINAGDPNYPYDPNETDLDGRRRIVSGRIDMGAYELLGLIYVDDDAPNDPGPYDPNISDPLENGSQSHPFDIIQEAIDVAADNDSVGVYPGLYTESTEFLGKAITVTSVEGAAVLQSPSDYAVSFYHGEGADSIFKNFVVRNSFAGFLVLVGSPTIKNVTVVNNGTGVVADDGAVPNISNSIFWNNTSGDLFQCQARYSCIESDGNGPGNISQDPLFVDPNGDYHLKSEGWRWNENVGAGSSWTWDSVTSRCIDAGNPGSPLDNELLTIPRDPDNIYGINVRINMGAYGGTAEASMGPHDWAFLADLNSDGVVNFLDFAEQAADWQTNGNEYPGDLNWDGTVNMPDCKALAEDWLKTTEWAQ